MLRLLILSGLFLGLMTGCATTHTSVSSNTHESPLQQVLKAQPEIRGEYLNTSIEQVFDRIESPTAAKITVTQTGLMDDSVSAVRTEYSFKLDQEKWQLQNKQQSYQCVRAEKSNGFQSQLCP
ncbi:hypothetical protein [Acinetobacter sp.]|uniref:hypothetical protein n=1 Tax=Acinetobacter sp. TaxID=472 RepID=UPI0031CDFAB1